MILRDLLRILGSDRRDGRNLTHQEAYRAFELIFQGGQSEIQTGAFLIALRWKGVSVAEVTAFAQAARDQAKLPCQGMRELVCLCPPHDGFDTLPPLEVAAGLIAAAAGAHVLILTDRTVPPKRGLTAASSLEGLGLSMTWDPSEAEDWIHKTRFAVASTSGMLPALMGLRRVRGEIGVRTPLSTVEKLIAPSGTRLIVGAQSGPVLGIAIDVLQTLGHPAAAVLQGPQGGVIPAVKRRTRGLELTGSHVVPLSIEPGDFGLACTQEPDLPMFGPPEDGYGMGDNPELVKACGRTTMAVLAGETGPARNAALLGAALILKIAEFAPTMADGVSLATEALDAGAAGAVLERLRALS
jgi:anthranilate phosphoribosyltransferase